MVRKPLVYILHGWAVDQFNQQKWQPFMAALNSRGIETKFLPIPGLSSTLNEVWNLQNFVDWLKRQLPATGAVVLGHSFGGQLAIRTAAQSPELFEKLILLDSSGIRDHSIKAVLKRSVFLVAAKIGKLLFPFTLARKVLHKLARERDYLNAPPLMRRAMSLVIHDEIRNDLESVLCPTLIVWGENDRITPLKNAELKKQKIKNSQLKIIKGARHSPQFTHVDETADLVANFLLRKNDD